MILHADFEEIVQSNLIASPLIKPDLDLPTEGGTR